MSARRVAYDVLRRIEGEGAYANLALGPALDGSDLSGPDRRFVTDLVYGTTRMRRAGTPSRAMSRSAVKRETASTRSACRAS